MIFYIEHDDGHLRTEAKDVETAVNRAKRYCKSSLIIVYHENPETNDGLPFIIDYEREEL